jgi:hypothetical protein
LIDKENEYKNAFNDLKKWSKHWTTPSAIRHSSAGNAMVEPAESAYVFILSQDKKISFEERLKLLYKFSEEENEKEKNRKLMKLDFYSQILTHIRRAINNIEKGEPVRRIYITK